MFSHHGSYHMYPLSVSHHLAGCRLERTPLFSSHLLPNLFLSHPSIQMSTQVTGWQMSKVKKDRGRDGDVGIKGGFKDTLFMLLHIDVLLAHAGVVTCPCNAHTHTQQMQINSNASRHLPKGPGSLTQQFWDWMDEILCVGLWVGTELLPLGADDEVRLLWGSCEKGSNEGIKV